MEICIRHRANTRRITARLRADGSYSITVPSSMSDIEAHPIIEQLINQLDQQTETKEWQSYFADQQQIRCFDGSIIKIARQTSRPKAIVASRTESGIMVGVGESFQFGTRETDLAINRMLMRIAHSLSPALLRQGDRIASQLGLHVARWKIGRGHRTLGTCTAGRIITLSSINIFLPPHLTDYIICHELAHLSEMNHSPRFHEICNRYTAGRESALKHELRRFKWPIIR